MSKEQRQSSKLLKPRSFDVCKNVAVLMIVMLDHLELDMKVSDASMKTAEPDDCRGMSRGNGDANDVLAIIQEEARFSHKNR